jgi:hypothetical protein
MRIRIRRLSKLTLVGVIAVCSVSCQAETNDVAANNMKPKGRQIVASAPATQEKDNSDSWKIPSDKKNFHVFLLMGQSNMSGGVNIAAGDTKPVPRVLKMRLGYKKKTPKWVPAAHPLHPRRPNKKKRFGPGMSFAQAYLADKPGVVVGLVPMAWGGRGIAQLDKGSGIYSDAIRHAKVAMQAGTLKGVLWHQGESDTVTQEKADAYEKKLHRLIKDVRKDLGDAKLPFIVGNLAEFYGTGKDHNAPDRVARISKIRGILRSLPDKIPHTGFVESTGCSPATARAKVHFNRKSSILLGKRYAKVYADMTAKANKPKKATP